MTPLTLIREALSSARAARIPSLLVALVVATMCFTAVATVGRQASLEAELAADLASPSARTLTVTDVGQNHSIPPQAVPALSSVTGVEAILASDVPIDVVNGGLGHGSDRVSMMGVAGDIDRAVEITRGRMPHPGEAMISAEARETLNMSEGVGYVEHADGRQWPVVAVFRARDPFTQLDGMVITPAHISRRQARDGASFRQIRVLAESVEFTSAVQESTLSVLKPEAADIQVQSAPAASPSSHQISGQVAGFGRSLLLLILAAGAFFVAIVVLADVLIRQRDLGRRRTLGISRGDLVAFVALRTLGPATVGASLGALAGWMMIEQRGGHMPGDFIIAVAVLGSLTAAIACLPPAIFASRRDPVDVMRTA